MTKHLFVLFVYLPLLSAAQISFNGSYSEDFDNYRGTESTLPVGWQVSASGSLIYRGTSDGFGLDNGGGTWAYGMANSNEYALGSIASSSSGNINLCLNLQNSSGSTITSLEIAYDFEQWRFSNSDGLTFEGTGALAGANLSALDQAASPTGSNGQATSKRKRLLLTGLSIADGDLFGICARDRDGSGADSGCALDNLSVQTSAILPLQLLSFEANDLQDAIELRWRTGLELEHESFEIMRSTNGLSFQHISTIFATGSHSSYAWVDHSAQSTSDLIYRLDFIDADGSRSSSPLLSVQRQEPNYRVVLLPEDLLVEHAGSFKLELQIIDVMGRFCRSSQIEQGSNQISLSDLPAGQYYCVLMGPEKRIIKKMMLAR